ncbi:MAG: hypothetical protein M1388_01255 [Thaumarchaeota archaeon]|nr:hypothetical protein [Nitrososphaerota archaeon]
MQSTESLKCTSCGAPLPASEDGDIITCVYCGVAQRRLDVEKYIDQLRADVYGWVRSLVPASAALVESVDAVARAQIFELNIRGELAEKSTSLSMQLLKVGSVPLYSPPFARMVQGSSLSASNIDAKEMLSQAVKFQGLTSFAQTEDQKAFLSEAVSVSEALGYISNALRIYAAPQERSYATVARNFAGAAAAMDKDISRSAGALRMRGLESLSKGTAALMGGELAGAEEAFASADKLLADAQGAVIRQPSIVAWYAAIKAERSLVESMKLLLAGVRASRSYSLNSLDSLGRFERYVRNFENARAGISMVINSDDHLEPETFRQLATFFSAVCMARSGSSTVETIGTGPTWLACWLTELSYSFETGALFMKKGQAVQERILVSGAFPIQPQLMINQPQAMVTDIFSVRTESTFSDRLMGHERTLTAGIGYNTLGTLNRGGLPYSSPVIPSLCTKVDAARMADIYLEKVRQRLRGKLRIGTLSVSRLVYVGGQIDNGWLAISGLPSSMSLYVGDEKGLLKYSI